MITGKLSEEDISEIKNIWQAIRFRMNERWIKPDELSRKVGLSPEIIKRGVHGEPIGIRHILPKFVFGLGLMEIERRGGQGLDDNPSYEECKKLLMPPPAMPPFPGDFWEKQN